MGKALAPFRKHVVLATKFHIHPEDLEEGASLDEAVERHLKASMKRLGTDYIDLYYLHRTNDLVPVEEIAEVMGMQTANPSPPHSSPLPGCSTNIPMQFLSQAPKIKREFLKIWAPIRWPSQARTQGACGVGAEDIQ